MFTFDDKDQKEQAVVVKYRRGCTVCQALRFEAVAENEKKESKKQVQPTAARKKPLPLPLNDTMMLKA